MNTVSRRPPDGTGPDSLHDYGDLLVWSTQAGLLDPEEQEALSERASRDPDAATAVLERARALREASWQIFSALARDQVPCAADLEPLNAELGRALIHTRVTAAGDGYDWCWTPAGDSLEAPLWPLARSAAELLVSDERRLVKECGAERCLWLFVDGTRNHRRRWCDMSTCGNRAKVRKHRKRQREQREDA